MAQVCELTGKTPLTGNQISHSNRKTSIRQRPNLKARRYFVEGLNTTVGVKICTRAIRTIDKYGGLAKTLLQAGGLTLSPNLRKIKNRLASR